MNLPTYLAMWSLPLLAMTASVLSGEPHVLWETHLNADYPRFADSTADLAVDKAGNLFVIGTTDTIDGLTAAFVGKYASSGEQKWGGIFMQAGPRYTRGNALALDRMGQPILVGTNVGTGGGDGQLIVMKWSTAGNVLFSALINQPDGTSAEGIAVAVDATDHFYVAANHAPRSSPDSPPNAVTTGFLRKYSPTGEPEWALSLQHPDAARTRVNAMTLDPAGHVLLAGSAVLNNLVQPAAAGVPAEEQTTYATFKISPAGAIEWSDLYARDTRGDNRAAAITTDADGAVYVTGSSLSPHSTTLTAVTTLKYTATGVRAWESHFDAIERASEDLGIRSFAGTSVAVDDNVWVGCSPYLLLQLSPSFGSNGGWVYTYYTVNSGVDATVDRLLLLERGRGMLHCGSISDAASPNDLYVQHVDVAFNRGWSVRFHPAGANGSEIVDMARGLQDRLHFGANYFLPEGQPTSDGVLFTVAPPAVPTVQVFAVEPLALEPFRPGWLGINGRFRVQLSSPAEQDLAISYSLEGTAHWDIDDGADYVSPPSFGLLVIKQGRTSGDIVIRPVADKLREPPESVVLTLSPTSLPTLNDYKIGRAAKATVWILDAIRIPFFGW